MIAVYGPKAGVVPPPKPRVPKRRIFTATVKFDTGLSVSNLLLDIAAGCWTITTDAEGNRTGSARDDRARLWCTVGDRFVLSHADVTVDEVACVRVTHVEQNAHRMRAELVAGKLSPNTTTVHVMPAGAS